MRVFDPDQKIYRFVLVKYLESATYDSPVIDGLAKILQAQDLYAKYSIQMT
jgi:hypothetical protein